MAYTSAAVPITYHNIGHPSHQCRNCNATMWYEEREEKSKNANEVKNRTGAFIDKETSKGVDEQIVTSLIQMLDHYSSLSKAFRMVKDWSTMHNSVNFHLRLHSKQKTTRQYNAPTVSEVAALIVNDFGDGLPTRDIIINSKDNGPKCVSELHPSYMALQYPLLFPYEEDGFHDKIPNNQDTLRVELYHNLCDAVTRGDTSAVGLGKRIVLPRTFTGSLRYMMQNYQDAMALCRTYDNPDLFITFTSNPKLAKSSKMCRISHARNHMIEPEIRTLVYVIEFQKRGLPHAHILLWLEEHCKCKTPSDIDDIISVELPSPNDDPDAYKIVTDYMLHGPCGKDARNAACTTDGKSKQSDPTTRSHTYAEIPKHYVWHEKDKLWKQRKQRKCIGRIVYSSLAYGEQYYLRMLLNVVRGVQGFEELMTVNNKLYATFKETFFAYSLLNSDREWTRALSEASLWALGPQL
ncbi:DNA helicase PIF1, ATP-dependent [Tanacetum coccineum]